MGPSAVAGANYKIHKSIIFDKSINVFNEYVDDLYSKKSNPKITAASRYIYKLLLNTLYGVMGASQDTNKVIIVESDSDKMAEIVTKYNIININYVGEYAIVTYEENIHINNNSTVTGYMGAEIINNEPTNFSNIIVAMGITASAREKMHRAITLCDFFGIKVYYTDTDSIFTDKPIPEYLIGDGLGMFKEEYNNIVEAYFLGPKVYGLKLDNGNEIIKFKGISKNTVDFDLLKSLYHSKTPEPITIQQTKFKSDSKMGPIKSITQQHTYRGIHYSKGEKIFNDKGE